MRKTFAAAALAVAAFAGIGAAPAASAAPVNPAGSGTTREAVSYIPNAKGSVTNWHLAKGSVYGDNLGPGMVDWFTTVYNGSVHESGLDADLKARISPIQGATNVTGYPIHHVGGSIFTDAKATEVPFSNITLQPGKTYKIEYAAQAEWMAGVVDFATGVQFQVSPWLNKNADANYDPTEAVPGAAPARSYMPQLAGREASASGFVFYTVPADAEPVALQIAGYGYDNAGSAAYNGKIKLTTVSLSATLV